MVGKSDPFGLRPPYTYGRERTTTTPAPAGNPEYERTQPITADDRRAMLRSYFRSKGFTEEQVEAAVKV